MRSLDNSDHSVISIGSPSTPNMTPSIFETYYTTEKEIQILLEHQSGTLITPTCESTSRTRSGMLWPGSVSSESQVSRTSEQINEVNVVRRNAYGAYFAVRILIRDTPIEVAAIYEVIDDLIERAWLFSPESGKG